MHDGVVNVWKGWWPCIHGKRRNLCRECGGSTLCKHNRDRFYCRECGGGGVCEHERRRDRCKDCGGVGLCRHGRQRSQCKECGGSSICEHNRKRNLCRECHGASICGHDRIRVSCKDCGGSGICEHGRQRGTCKDCGSNAFCQHDRRRFWCKVCGGNGICQHNRRRKYCKDCGGVSLCSHGRQPNQCFLCGNGKAFCVLCKVTQLDARLGYEGHCAKCYHYLYPERWVPSMRLKRRETVLHCALVKAFGETSFTWDRKIDGGCSMRRPDFRFECFTHTVICECDEGGHQDSKYTSMCDNKRTMQLFQDLGSRPIVFIHFNPDDYVDSNGVSHPSCFGSKREIHQVAWDCRVARLTAEIKLAMATVPTKEVTIIKLFYTGTS